jgi:ubiquinol-cytochrome c reductase iron-sulfur subunit
MSEAVDPADSAELDEKTRRDFLFVTTSAVGAVGVTLAAWPLIDQSITVVWRGKPVFIRYRTAKEIELARVDDKAELIDPETDAARVQKEQWLVMVGVCTHLGCIPLGQKGSDPKGEFGGWFCPCHGSHYDTSGRIRRGPAPKNLVVPEYAFLSNTSIKIG